MKLIIKTTYENVDKAWLAWWLDNNGPNYGVNIRNPLPHEMTSKDPTSEVVATTRIEVEEAALEVKE